MLENWAIKLAASGMWPANDFVFLGLVPRIHEEVDQNAAVSSVIPTAGKRFIYLRTNEVAHPQVECQHFPQVAKARTPQPKRLVRDCTNLRSD